MTSILARSEPFSNKWRYVAHIAVYWTKFFHKLDIQMSLLQSMSKWTKIKVNILYKVTLKEIVFTREAFRWPNWHYYDKICRFCNKIKDKHVVNSSKVEERSLKVWSGGRATMADARRALESYKDNPGEQGPTPCS